MKPFVPKRAFFEPEALEYPLGKELYEKLQALAVPIKFTGSHNRITGIPGNTAQESFREAKRTLVVGVRKSINFAGCKPSAHYQLPLNTSCPSMCEYCYLATTLGKKPYLRVYVNIEEIFARAESYMAERAPEITWFEGAATSDPIPTEYLTGLLSETIEFFGRQELGRFRFVTKHDKVDTLLHVRHNGHTRFRFSLNAEPIIKKYEHATPSMSARVAAAAKVAQAGYPLGFIIAPIFYFPGWQEEYAKLFEALDAQLPEDARHDLTFELISHRFTKRAKNTILDLFPETTLPMDESERKLKYGQFGYVKYIYHSAVMGEIKAFMEDKLAAIFPQANIEYLV
ncbi:Spore photoproduct lyase [uncultured Sporomusa sp.]|uniref:Spore photoproduct lyase n=1 Tax=uncultured Sporomusa sp. TaxID=307249 RepID=A0A212LTX3_9FIRM|nr:spore photoproduct lyase [uncultured Sporomusa sp.]SCM80983.1 Spore photoproduct lyase [uncultured Sporomusa sp.]